MNLEPLSLRDLVFAAAAGTAIAAACGLRAFLPLLALGLAARFGMFHLRPGAEWMASDPALWALGIATVLEIASDKVPVVSVSVPVTVGLPVRAAPFASLSSKFP